MTLILRAQYVVGIVLGLVEDTKLRKIQPQGPYHLVREVSPTYTDTRNCRKCKSVN